MFTISNYNSPSHQLFLESAYGVIVNIYLTYPVKNSIHAAEPESKVRVTSQIAIYASKEAYDTNAEILHYRSVNVENATDNLTEIKTLIVDELSN